MTRPLPRTWSSRPPRRTRRCCQRAASSSADRAATRTLTLTPVAEATGQTTVTVTVSDGALTTTRTALITVIVAPPPLPPTGLMGSAIGTEVTLTWIEATTGATPTFFVIEGGSGPGLTTLPVIVTPTRVTRWTLQLPAGVYFFRVRAANRAGMSAVSNEATVVVTTALQLPGSPTGLAATVVGARVTVGWQPASVGGTPAALAARAGDRAGRERSRRVCGAERRHVGDRRAGRRRILRARARRQRRGCRTGVERNQLPRRRGAGVRCSTCAATAPRDRRRTRDRTLVAGATRPGGRQLSAACRVDPRR